MQETQKLSFSGHETFYCRYLWLKKGYDFLKEEKNFADEQAIVDLGVGKNMISAIKFWMKAFNLVNIKNGNIELTQVANKIFDKTGWDPYLEDIGTIWLLHYLLIQKQRASLYSIIFNDYRKKRTEFDKSHLTNYIKRLAEDNGIAFNENTVDKDISVFINNYVIKSGKSSIEDNFSNFLSDLNLVSKIKHPLKKGDFIYSIEKKTRIDLPIEMFLFAILDVFEDFTSISFISLLNDKNSPGNIFVLHEDDLKNKINQLTEKYSGIIYTDDAGIGNLQIKKKYNKWEIIEDYYAK